MNKIIEGIIRRLKKSNKNWLCIICGPTGSGKSYSAMKIAEMIDPTFDISRVVFNAKDFMKVLNNGMKRGQILIWDEAGVGIPAREWYTISNKAISYVFQTFRHMNIGVIMTTPSFDFIDSQTRKLFHNYIETCGIDKEKQEVMTKFMIVTFNPRFGKEYFKYPRIDRRVVKRLNIAKPSEKLIDAYEEKKINFSESLRREVGQDVDIAKAKEIHRRLTDMEIMRRIKKEGIELDVYTLQFYFGIGKDRAYRVIHNWEKFSPLIKDLN